MKIYRNEQNVIVIDGEHITTIGVPKNELPVNEWLEKRITINEKVIITGFIFDYDYKPTYQKFKDESKEKV